MDRDQLAKMIDYSLLKVISRERLTQGCSDAARLGFASVTVNPNNVKEAIGLLEGTGIAVGTVAAFPLGNALTEVKVLEAKRAVEMGAAYVDMVLNIYALKAGEYHLVCDDIRAVKTAAGPRALTRVILETCHLTDVEKVRACELSIEAGADFVKTSTGFGSGGATVEDVRLLVRTAKGRIQVKAAGGIRNLKDALAMIEAGATRIASSRSLEIIAELEGHSVH